MDDAPAVAQHLHFDMTRPRNESLEIESAISERRPRLGAGLRQQASELRFVGGDADAATAAARRRAGAAGGGGAAPVSGGAVGAPRPPPPAAALIIRGKPMRPPSERACSTSATTPSLPGTVLTPASAASCRARALSPIARIAS